jgi:tRNA threonylcarbamoyl adenosine modification protein YjeE
VITIFDAWELSESELSALVERLKQTLWQSDDEPFVLWLEGEMGTGKTTLVRHLLTAIGLPATTPVVSPTYTIVNEYHIGQNWYAHLDLYRAEDSFSFEELGISDFRQHRGFFVEWPASADAEDFLPATHILRITYKDDKRKYSLLKV